MNFLEAMKSVELVLAAGQVPLLIGETGIGKTTLATKLAQQKNWHLVTIDGNLLKEGEIGGLPTISSYTKKDLAGVEIEEKTTVYAVHHKLKEIDDHVVQGEGVLLFIDEINRCEHAVQQELMNLILNREINGYSLGQQVNIIAAMNPTDSFDYQTVEMDAAQQNRFVWLYMEADYMQWLDWATEMGIEEKVMEFISTYPEYLNKVNEDDINATPRSYERVSQLYSLYKENKDAYSRQVFYNVIRGNVGKLIAEEFVSYIESAYKPLMSFEDVFANVEVDELPMPVAEVLKTEAPTRLYLMSKNILRHLSRLVAEPSAVNTQHITINSDTVYVLTQSERQYIHRLVAYLAALPTDLRMGVMKDIRNTMLPLYTLAAFDDTFIELYFAMQRS